MRQRNHKHEHLWSSSRSEPNINLHVGCYCSRNDYDTIQQSKFNENTHSKWLFYRLYGSIKTMTKSFIKKINKKSPTLEIFVETSRIVMENYNLHVHLCY